MSQSVPRGGGEDGGSAARPAGEGNAVRNVRRDVIAQW